MSKDTKDFGAIYEQTLSLCPPYQLSGPWQTVPVPADIRRPPEDPAAVVAELQAKYPHAVLLESGVAATGTDGGVVLEPALCDAGTAIIGLRKTFPTAALRSVDAVRGHCRRRDTAVCVL